MTPMQCTSTLRAVAAFALATLAVAPAYAAMSADELAKLAQNPVGNLISQFALVISSHIIFPAFMIGLAAWACSLVRAQRSSHLRVSR